MEYKTLVTQEMLKKGYLAANSCYVCIAHTPEVVEQYIDSLNDVFSLIAKCEDGLPLENVLEGPVCHAAFKRLN